MTIAVPIVEFVLAARFRIGQYEHLVFLPHATFGGSGLLRLRGNGSFLSAALPITGAKAIIEAPAAIRNPLASFHS
jgi:hypothetical protein